MSDTKTLIGQGELVSSNGVMWSVRLYEYGTADWSNVMTLDFPAEEPVVIEKDDNDPENAVIGSRLTLRLLSPGDRTFAKLYTRETGHVGIELYRAGVLYWAGTMDTELYEEPYTDVSDYEVELTFSDFEAFDHIKPSLTGIHSIGDYLADVMAKVRLDMLSIDETMITTKLSGSTTKMSINDVGVDAHNWIDEDGVVSTYKDVMESFLQPLGLRMEQKCGKIWVYDLNGAATLCSSEAAEWDSDDQMMGVGKAVNTIKVTFSPYSDSVISDKKSTYSETVDTNDHAMSKTDTANGAVTYLQNYQYDPSNSLNASYLYRSFNVFYGRINDDHGGFASIGSGNSYFHITPVLGGMDACSGVASLLFLGCNNKKNSPVALVNCDLFLNFTSWWAFTSKRVYLPPIPDGSDKYLLRIRQEMLMDVRYNPFEEAGEYNESGNYGSMQNCMNYVMIPAKILLYGSETGGTATKQWDNASLANFSNDGSKNMIVPSIGNTKGTWGTPETEGSNVVYRSYLEWYDQSDMQSSSGIGGWKMNRQMMGMPRNGINAGWKNMEEGQYITYPAEGGWLEISMGNTYYFRDNEKGWAEVKDTDAYHNNMRWWLWKMPQVDIVRNDLTLSEAKCGDVEYKGLIDAYAHDDLELDTKCGTRITVMPTAKGIYRRTSTGEQINKMSRAGWDDQPCEHLLIRTLYSQYAVKHLKLSGTIVSSANGMKLKTVSTEAGKEFLVTGEQENINEDINTVTLTELSADEEMTSGLYTLVSETEDEDEV